MVSHAYSCSAADMASHIHDWKEKSFIEKRTKQYQQSDFGKELGGE